MPKFITYPGITALDFKHPKRDEAEKYAKEHPEEYWAKQAERVTWTKKFNTVLDTSDKYLHRWYPDGEMNITYNCLDRHVEAGRGDSVAMFADSVYTGEKRAWTYAEMLNRVGRLASVL